MMGGVGAGAATYVPPQRIGFKPVSAADTLLYRHIASQALDHFGVRDYSIDRLVRHSNITAQITRPGRPGLALRMRTGPAVSARTELTWLLAVRAGTCVSTVAPYGEILEEMTVEIAHPVHGDPVECSLFLWAEGEPLAAHLTAPLYRQLGVLAAELHTFATGWTAPAGMAPLRWDRTMYYSGTRLAVANVEHSSIVGGRDAARVEEIVAAADIELVRLAAMHDPIFLHGNIEMWNVLVDPSGQLRLLDFEDVMLGQPIQDIAITLYYGMERRDYGDLASAFRAGYASVREWPLIDERVLRLLMAARAVMLLNHALLTEPDPRPVMTRLMPIILRAN